MHRMAEELVDMLCYCLCLFLFTVQLLTFWNQTWQQHCVEVVVSEYFEQLEKEQYITGELFVRFKENLQLQDLYRVSLTVHCYRQVPQYDRNAEGVLYYTGEVAENELTLYENELKERLKVGTPVKLEQGDRIKIVIYLGDSPCKVMQKVMRW